MYPLERRRIFRWCDVIKRFFNGLDGRIGAHDLDGALCDQCTEDADSCRQTGAITTPATPTVKGISSSVRPSCLMMTRRTFPSWRSLHFREQLLAHDLQLFNAIPVRCSTLLGSVCVITVLFLSSSRLLYYAIFNRCASFLVSNERFQLL